MRGVLRGPVRFAAAGVAAGACVVAAADHPAAAAPARYAFVDLGTFGGPQSEARAINDAGRVTGWAWGAPRGSYNEYDFATGTWYTNDEGGPFTVPNAFLYDSRKPNATKVNLGRADEASAGEAINNGGRVVGTLGWASNRQRAFRLGYGPLDETVDNGFFHPEIHASVASDINDRNEIVGNAYLPGGHGAFVYRNNEMKSLGNLLGSPGWAQAINNNGKVVGDSYLNPDYTGPIHAFVHDTGTGQTRDLGVLATQPRPYNVSSHAWDISDNGQVVGTSHADGAFGVERAFLHDGTRMIDLGVLPDASRSDAYALNEQGQVVGRSGGRAFVWDDGVMYDLNQLTDGLPSGWSLAWANDVNESGQIVGAVYNTTTTDDVYHGFVLTPLGGANDPASDDVSTLAGQFSALVNPTPLAEPVVPEPSSAVLLLAAGAGAGMRRRRS